MLRRKERAVFETSCDESSTSTDSDNDSSEEPRRKRRKTKKTKKNSKKRHRQDFIESEITSESDKSFVPLELQSSSKEIPGDKASSEDITAEYKENITGK